MSHVDEGQLHAYLDGGLSAMDAVRVERHLAECAPCRQRLEEARALVQRAAKLLEWASPAERAAPPLSDLRPAAPRWRTPVAWAATIIVALGVGLYGGPRLFRGPSDKKATTNAVDAERRAEPQPATPVATLDADTARPQARDQTGGAPAPAAPPAVATARDERLAATPPPAAAAPVAQPERDSGVVVTGFAATAADRVAALPDSAAKLRVDSGVFRARREVATAAAAAPTGQVLTPAAAPRAAAPELNRVAAEAESRARAFPAASTWPVISRDSATRLLRGPLLAVPDLPIVTVRASADAVVVEHVLPPGQIIRLVERRARVEESAGAAGAVGGRAANELLARYVGDVRVEIAGPFSADSLSKLLERVRAVP